MLNFFNVCLKKYSSQKFVQTSATYFLTYAIASKTIRLELKNRISIVFYKNKDNKNANCKNKVKKNEEMAKSWSSRENEELLSKKIKDHQKMETIAKITKKDH